MQQSTRRFLAMAFAVGLISAAPKAHAASAGVIGIMNMSGSSNTPPDVYNSRWNAGFGGFVRGDLIPGLDIEVGANVYKRTYGFNNLGNFDFSVLEIPLMVRVTAIPIFTAGAGFYGSFKLGQTGEDAAVLNQTPTIKGLDFGLIVAAGVEFPLGPVGLFAELRYLFGLADLDDGVGSLQTRNLQGVGGVRIGF